MEGEKLYLNLSQQDFTGTKADQYAQLLNTIFYHLSGTGEIGKFYDLLETAERENKRIEINDPSNIKDEYFFKDLILVTNSNN